MEVEDQLLIRSVQERVYLRDISKPGSEAEGTNTVEKSYTSGQMASSCVLQVSQHPNPSHRLCLLHDSARSRQRFFNTDLMAFMSPSDIDLELANIKDNFGAQPSEILAFIRFQPKVRRSSSLYRQQVSSEVKVCLTKIPVSFNPSFA